MWQQEVLVGHTGHRDTGVDSDRVGRFDLPYFSFLILQQFIVSFKFETIV